MEIERKFTVKQLPEHLEDYPCRHLEQGYLCTDPVVRVRQMDDTYILTCKGKGFLVREEWETPLSEEAYRRLAAKVDGRVIVKDRYLIPWGSYTVELDVFGGELAGLVIAEVEFPSVEEAMAFTPPHWFDRDVTENPAYSNSNLSLGNPW